MFPLQRFWRRAFPPRQTGPLIGALVMAACTSAAPTPSPSLSPSVSVDLVWETYASTVLPYSLAYPTTWSIVASNVDASQAVEVFHDTSWTVEGCSRVVAVRYYASATKPLAEWVSEVSDGLIADGTPPEFSDPIEVAGFAGRLFGVHIPTSECGKVHSLLATFLQNGRGWEVNVLSPAGDEHVDRQLLDQLLLTFEPMTEPAQGGPQGLGRLADLPVGTCFDAGADFEILGYLGFKDRTQLWFGARDAVAVQCDQPHRYEVIAILPPGTNREDCDAEFAAYVGTPFAESTLGYILMLPDDDEQSAGVPFICAVDSPTAFEVEPIFGVEQTTGTLKGSRR